jgi:hypothetical protein
MLVHSVSQEERSIFSEAIESVIQRKNVYMYMCPIPNCFQARAISLYSSKIVDKKEILLTVSNSGLRGLEITFPPHDPSDAGSNPAEVVEFLRTEKFRER